MTNQNLMKTSPLDSLHKEVDRLFGGFFSDFSLPSLGFRNGQNVPRMDIRETDGSYEIDVELPGIPASDVEVTVKDGVLTVKGERKSESEQKDKDYLRVECSYGRYERSVSLPDDADEASIKASSKDGVLSIAMPRKSGVKPEARKIDVKVA